MRLKWIAAIAIVAMLGAIAQAAGPTTATASATLESLNARFAFPDASVRFIAGQGGLPCIEVNSSLCTGRIYLQGAHVAAWQPKGEQPVIFMSSKSDFIPGKPIRGGVPVCFPWFASKAGDPAAPGHGFVRTMEWSVESVEKMPSGDVSLVLSQQSSADTKGYFPHEFQIRHHVIMGKQLSMELEVRNTGTDPFRFAEALHAYFQVQSIEQVSVSGLNGTEYIDKVDGAKQKRQADDATFPSQVDRNYLNTGGALIIRDKAVNRNIRIEKTSSMNIVVWNPGQARAKTIVDLGENDWPHMLCVETANLGDNEPTLTPGGIHQMKAVISIER